MKGKTILICDDDESIVEILRLVLSSYGFSVIAEQNSLNILSAVERSQPDLLLVDLWMPPVNGDVVIRNLKSNPSTNTIPIILISASVGADDVANHIGADGFIEKPFQLQELISLIESKLCVN